MVPSTENRTQVGPLADWMQLRRLFVPEFAVVLTVQMEPPLPPVVFNPNPTKSAKISSYCSVGEVSSGGSVMGPLQIQKSESCPVIVSQPSSGLVESGAHSPSIFSLGVA